MTKTITITADAGNGETAFFKVIPSGTMEQFLDDIEWVSDIDSVKWLEEEGAFKIV